MTIGPPVDRRPDDHIDAREAPTPIRLGPAGWARWAWRQVTSMRTALLLLLLLALAAVPGSLLPQRSSDPNGVIQYFRTNPDGARIADSFQLFSVYTSVWFSSVYILLFISLIGCLIPRTLHHWKALRQPPPETPRNLLRLPAYAMVQTEGDPNTLIDSAVRMLRRSGYRTRTYDYSVSAERGYIKESANLAFHLSLLGVLLTVAIGGGYTYVGQRVVVEGQTFVNTRSAYDSFTPGRFFNDSQLVPYSLTLDDFAVDYVDDNPAQLGFITDFTASISTQMQGSPTSVRAKIKVNEPLALASNEIYLMGNGYAPELTVRNPAGDIVFSDEIPFLPQDSNLTSLGVVKVPDGLAQQVGLIGFFYPTQVTTNTGAFASIYPDIQNPVITLDVYEGDLGLNDGDPKSVYVLDTSVMTKLAGRGTAEAALEIRPGQTVDLPNGLGTIEFVDTKRFASFDISHDPTKTPMLIFAILVVVTLCVALFVPRRRVWIRASQTDDGVLVEYAGLSRGEDAALPAIINSLVDKHLPAQPKSR